MGIIGHVVKEVVHFIHLLLVGFIFLYSYSYKLHNNGGIYVTAKI